MSVTYTLADLVGSMQRALQVHVLSLVIHKGLTNPTVVWSMPGGFTSSERGGYQPVDDERPRNNTNIRTASTPTAPSTTQVPPGAYQV